MQFFDPPGPEIPVTWYFCAETAKTLPFKTRFGSGNWASDRLVWPGPGEVLDAPRPWSDGQPPGPPVLALFTSLGLERFPASFASVTTAGTFNTAGDMVVIVCIYFFALGDPKSIASVTDSDGVVFVKDHEDLSSGDNRVGLSVWRGFPPAGRLNNKITVNFPGVSMYITVHAMQFSGVKNAAPAVVDAGKGHTADPIRLPKLQTPFGDSLGVALWSSGGASAQTSGPFLFLKQAESLSSGAFEDGSTWTRIVTGARQYITPAWTVTNLYHWVAAALFYEAVPHFVPPGTSFCGPKEAWEEGAPEGPPTFTDIFGMSPCCGDFPIWLHCPKPEQTLTLTLTAIYQKSPTSLTSVGQKLTFLPSLTPEVWLIDPDDQERIAPGFGVIFLDCISQALMFLAPNAFFAGLQFPLLGARFPPGLVFKLYPAIWWGLDPFTQVEYWDFTVTWPLEV